jgi:hypothetical protein
MAAGLAVTYSLFAFRDFWPEARFWMTFVLLAILQVPLVIGLRQRFGELNLFSSLAFAIWIAGQWSPVCGGCVKSSRRMFEHIRFLCCQDLA